MNGRWSSSVCGRKGPQYAQKAKELFFLKAGIMSANFSLSGELCVLKVSLKRFCKIGAVELWHFLIIFAGISF